MTSAFLKKALRFSSVLTALVAPFYAAQPSFAQG